MRTVCYHCGNFADGGDHPNSLRSDYARLQEQVEVLTKERDEACNEAAECYAKQCAAEAERDRLREAAFRVCAAAKTVEIHGNGALNSVVAPYLINDLRAALQKEPQP